MPKLSYPSMHTKTSHFVGKKEIQFHLEPTLAHRDTHFNVSFLCFDVENDDYFYQVVVRKN